MLYRTSDWFKELGSDNEKNGRRINIVKENTAEIVREKKN